MVKHVLHAPPQKIPSTVCLLRMTIINLSYTQLYTHLNTTLLSHCPIHFLNSSHKRLFHPDYRFPTVYFLFRSTHGDFGIVVSINQRFWQHLSPPRSCQGSPFLLIPRASFVTVLRFLNKGCLMLPHEKTISKTPSHLQGKSITQSKKKVSGSSMIFQQRLAHSMPVRRYSKNPVQKECSVSCLLKIRSFPTKKQTRCLLFSRSSTPFNKNSYEKNFVTCRMIIKAASASAIPITAYVAIFFADLALSSAPAEPM